MPVTDGSYKHSGRRVEGERDTFEYSVLCKRKRACVIPPAASRPSDWSRHQDRCSIGRGVWRWKRVWFLTPFLYYLSGRKAKDKRIKVSSLHFSRSVMLWCRTLPPSLTPIRQTSSNYATAIHIPAHPLLGVTHTHAASTHCRFSLVPSYPLLFPAQPSHPSNSL